MAYQSFFSGNTPTAPVPGSGYQSFFGTPTIAQPSATQLSQSRLVDSINNMQSLKPEDQVKLINKGIQAGLVDHTKGSQYIMQVLGSRQPAKMNLNPFEKVVNTGVNLGKSVVQPLAPIVKNFAPLAGPTSTQAQRNAVVKNQNITVPKNNASIEANIQAKNMLANGANPKDVQAFLTKAEQAKSQQNKSLAGALAYAGSFAVGGGELAGVRSVAGATKAILPTTIAGGVGGGGATLAVNPNASGKDISKNVAFGATGGAVLPLAGGVVASKLGRDEATRALINQSKMAGALAKARSTNAMGKLAVDEAKTTRIPVVGPTETAGARTAVGSVAVNNADRSSIPVKDMGTQTVGKATTATDKQYLVKSNQLTTAYNREMDSIKNLPPVTQKILQNKLDAKYSALQENLDNNYGKTSVSFNGRSTATATNGTKLPPSAMGEPAAFTPRTAPIKVDTAKVNTPTAKPPKTPSVSAADSTGLKPSGSAIRTQAAAIEKGMSEEEALTGATFRGVSHKEQAVKAANLVNEDPQKAMDIAMGRARGDNVSHEAAVYHAVKNAEIDRALKTGDWSTVQDLASSGRHTAVSEHAQALGAEGYNTNPHDPVAIMNDLAQTRAKVLGKNTASTVTKETKTVETAVKAATPKISKMDWHQFVESIKC